MQLCIAGEQFKCSCGCSITCISILSTSRLVVVIPTLQCAFSNVLAGDGLASLCAAQIILYGLEVNSRLKWDVWASLGAAQLILYGLKVNS